MIAIAVSIPDSSRVDLGDTIQATAVALNGSGDSVGATFRWASLDTILEIDSITGLVSGRVPGTGQIQVRTGNLLSNPQPITVFIRPDTAFADSTPAPDSVSIGTKTDSLSDSLRVRVQHYDPTDTLNLPARPVTFTLLYPTDTTSFKLVPQGPYLTDPDGLAVVQVKLRNRALPDSAVVQATVNRYSGAAVSGSPVTFVVRFYP